MKKCSYCSKVYSLSSLSNNMICPSCGGNLFDIDEKKVEELNERKSIFLKYGDIIDKEKLYKIACLIENGELKESFKNEAYEIFKKLAFMGDNNSRFKYAIYLLNNEPDLKDVAIKWLKMAAKEGNKPSRTALESLSIIESIDVKDEDIKEIINQEPIRIETITSDIQELIKQSLPSFLSIIVDYKEGNKVLKSCGSGFIIEGGYVITNAHVIGDNPLQIQGFFDASVAERPFGLYPVVVCFELDIAILKFAGLGLPQKLKGNELRVVDQELTFGQNVYTMGNPLNLGLSLSTGVVSSPRRETDYPENVKEVIQTNISLNQGNSGGALLDYNNNVVGVCTFIPKEANGGIGMCVPAKYILELINNINDGE